MDQDFVLDLCEEWSILSIPVFPVLLWFWAVVPVRLTFMDQIDFFANFWIREKYMISYNRAQKFLRNNNLKKCNHKPTMYTIAKPLGIK